MSTYAEEIGKRLREMRTEKDVSQEELAEQLGVSDSTIGRWEGGRAIPDGEKIYKLCKLFRCSPERLLRTYVKDNDEHLEQGSGLNWRVTEPYSIRSRLDQQRFDEEINHAVEIFRLIAGHGMGFQDIQRSQKFEGYNDDRLRQLVKVALLSSAIQLVNVNRDNALEQELIREFKPQLRQCFIAKTSLQSDPLVDATIRTEAVAFLAVKHALPSLPPHGRVGLTGGTTISRFVDLLPAASPELILEWYPLLAVPQQKERSGLSANSVITRLLYKQPGARGYRLSYVEPEYREGHLLDGLSQYSRQFIFNARNVLERARTVSAAFISVGTPEYQYQTTDAHLGLPELWPAVMDLNQEYQEQCVGDVLLSLVNEIGERVGEHKDHTANDAVVYSVGLDSLRHIAEVGAVWVLAARSGKGKARVIKAALKGCYINSIVVDATIAKELLEV